MSGINSSAEEVYPAGKYSVEDVTKAFVGRTVSIYPNAYYHKLSVVGSDSKTITGTLEDVTQDGMGRTLMIDGLHYTCPSYQLWEPVEVL